MFVISHFYFIPCLFHPQGGPARSPEGHLQAAAAAEATAGATTAAAAEGSLQFILRQF